MVQRETVDLPSYVELWLKDAGLHPRPAREHADYVRRYDTWLAWFEEQGAEAVGFGWIHLRRVSTGHRGRAPPRGLALRRRAAAR